MCTSFIYSHDIKWGLNFKPSGSPLKLLALDEKTLIKHLILNNLVPDTVLIRRKSQERSKRTNTIYLLPVAAKQRWSGCERHSSWIEQGEATWPHFGGNVTAVKLCFCYKHYSHINSPATTSLFHCKNDVWLQRKRNWTAFSLTSLLHEGCTPAHLILLSAV